MEKDLYFEYKQVVALLNKAKTKEKAPWRLLISTFEDLDSECLDLHAYYELGYIPFFVIAHCYYVKSNIPAIIFRMGPTEYEIEYRCFQNAGEERMKAFEFLKHCTFYKDTRFYERKSKNMNDILIEFLHATGLLFTENPKFIIK